MPLTSQLTTTAPMSIRKMIVLPNQMTEAKPLPLGVPAFKPIPVASHQEFLGEIATKRNEIEEYETNYSYKSNSQIRRVSDESTVDITKNEVQSIISPLAHVRIST